ncbi:hypothetical protein NT6N_24870 [Oceaniferula spumae]|uniref:Lipoprotein n=1 Tax=Oceaniferula spumae TaxID=2979115 RepID=A0AAT9FMU3_9BACT
MRLYWIIMVCIIVSSCVPCRFRSEESIRDSLLKKTPIGTTRVAAAPKIIEIAPRSHNQRYNVEEKVHSKDNEIGPIFMCYYLTSPLTSIGYRAVWHFDKYNRLSDIKVDSFADGP